MFYELWWVSVSRGENQNQNRKQGQCCVAEEASKSFRSCWLRILRFNRPEHPFKYYETKL